MTRVRAPRCCLATVACALGVTVLLASPGGAGGTANANGSSSGTTGSGHTTTTTHATHPAHPKLDQVGHVSFWECPAKTTEMLVAVNTLTLHRGATLNVSFTVRNVGTASCNYTAPYASVAPGPTRGMLEAGPCGSVGFAIVGPNHENVWPGNEVVNCPALGFAQLAPGATVSGTGTWDQRKPNSTSRVRTGRYGLVVDDTHFSFPLRLVTP
jgi:hypothetical protein